MSQQIVSVNDGGGITVADIKGNPMWIPTKVVELLNNGFVEDFWLRDAGPNINGLVGFSKSRPLYLDAEIADLVEFEEIPVAAGSRGTRMIAVGTRKGLGVRVSKDMIDEGNLMEVQDQITQLVNTFIRSRTRALRALLEDPSIPTIPAGAAWDTSNGRPRRDIANAMEKIASANVSGVTDAEDEFGFTADGIGISTALTPVLMDNDNFAAIYNKDSLVSEDIRYTGALPRKILGLDAAEARHWPKNKVLVGQRKVAGFRSDTRPLQSTGLYPEGNGPNGGPTESWRSDTTAKRVMGLDQPLALCWITGVVTP